MKTVKILSFIYVFLNFLSCKTEQIFDISVKQATEDLKKGDIAFILSASAEDMEEIIRINQDAPFYAGLLVEEQETAPKLRTARLFEAGLISSSEQTSVESGKKLLSLILADETVAEYVLRRMEADVFKSPAFPGFSTLKAAALYKHGRFVDARKSANDSAVFEKWSNALSLTSSMRSGGTISGELMDFFFDGPVDETQKWAYEEIKSTEFFSSDLFETESAVLRGHYATSVFDYREGLRCFRPILDEEKALFYKYPYLIADLGRCFQYADADQGVNLFSEWDAQENKETDPIARFYLLFFAGRMERQKKNYTSAAAFFEKAVSFAPDREQKDACIWYLLDVLQKSDPESVVPFIAKYAPLWGDAFYFSDILDTLCQYLTTNHKWTRMLELFPVIRRYADGASFAKYAYIVGRIAAEGFVPDAEIQAFTGIDGSSKAFFRIAFVQKNASFYYRAMSARYIGESIEISNEVETNEPETLSFMRGFFEYGAAQFATVYIEEFLKEKKAEVWSENTTYSAIDELRAMARLLYREEYWHEAIQFLIPVWEKEGLNYSDMEIYYPRPFKDMIEKYAELTKVNPAVLFGLIRTESTFRSAVVSHVGAVGLSQLMPETAEETALRIKRQGGPDYVTDGLHLTDPETNVHIGSFYLASLIKSMDDSLMFNLLAYNGGPNRVKRWRSADTTLPDDLFLETVPITETREYGKRVSASAAAYGYLYYGLKMEAILADIYKR
ncbi:MAG: lytic transglycosylase domain-containing protein [Treponema sp.]|jgi:soluble lytic murein transglycosylase|nr:lytic transglycosylase domain-containing protein [Treponema sp.]